MLSAGDGGVQGEDKVICFSWEGALSFPDVSNAVMTNPNVLSAGRLEMTLDGDDGFEGHPLKIGPP